jgi:hypothetical protein
VSSGVLDASALARAEAVANATGRSAADVLLRDLGVSKTAIADALTSFYGCVFWEPADTMPEGVPRAARDLPFPGNVGPGGRPAGRSAWVPVAAASEAVVIAMEDPHDLLLLDELKLRRGLRIEARVGIREDVLVFAGVLAKRLAPICVEPDWVESRGEADSEDE